MAGASSSVASAMCIVEVGAVGGPLLDREQSLDGALGKPACTTESYRKRSASSGSFEMSQARAGKQPCHAETLGVRAIEPGSKAGLEHRGRCCAGASAGWDLAALLLMAYLWPLKEARRR